MIRTRFAPSPTGYLHVGGLRTALYCYLFAKKNNGQFLLRIEDTDQERFVEGALENLIDTLHWIGITYDEGTFKKGPSDKNSEILQKGSHGPYIQSERTEIYREHVQKLLDSGHAYRCFCTKERLEEMRTHQTEQKLAPMYDRKCLDLPESEINQKIQAGEKFIIRQKMPYGSIKFKDLIRDNVQFDGKTIDDQVLMKSDGFPTYHLANVVDDHLMEITHVIRGEEWLPSTPKHIALYHAFGWQPPEFAHLPLLLNADRSKLSKRQGDVSVEDYIKKGYLKEAIINFVAFLGWNPGGGEENEIFSLSELEQAFSIEKVHKAGAIFNLKKLDWFNWRWKKCLFNNELEKIAKEIDPQVVINAARKDQLTYTFSNPELDQKFLGIRGKKLLTMCNHATKSQSACSDRPVPIEASESIGEPKDEQNERSENLLLPKEYSIDENKLLKALITIEEKILKNPKETPAHLDFYYSLPDYPKELLTHQKMGVDSNQAAASLKAGKEDLEKLEDWNLQTLQETLIKTVAKLGVKNGQLLWPLRAAMSGLEFSPGVFELAWVLGKEETIRRINLAVNKI